MAGRVVDKKDRLVKGALERLALPQALTVSVAIIDPAGTIVGVNDVWREFGRRNGLRIPDFAVGASYLRYCKSEPLEVELRALLAGKLDLLTRIYPCHSATEQRWFFLIGMPLSLEELSGAALLHVNLTPLVPPPMVARLKRPCDVSHGHIEPQINLDMVARSVESSSLEALSSQLTEMLVPGRQAPPSISPKGDAQRIVAEACLSKRELQILGLLAEGKTNTEIAKALFRSPNTIKLHVSRILRQLNVKSRTQAALLASKLSSNDLRRDGA